MCVLLNFVLSDGRKPQAEETELERMGESATCDEEETETEPTPPVMLIITPKQAFFDEIIPNF